MKLVSHFTDEEPDRTKLRRLLRIMQLEAMKPRFKSQQYGIRVYSQSLYHSLMAYRIKTFISSPGRKVGYAATIRPPPLPLVP